MRTLGLVCLTTACVFSVGCGASDEEEIRSAVRDFTFGIIDGNWERVCDVMTEDAQASLRTADMPNASCEESLNVAYRLPESDRRRLRAGYDFAVIKIEVNGDRATVQLKEAITPDGRPVANLRNEDGWRIDVP